MRSARPHARRKHYPAASLSGRFEDPPYILLTTFADNPVTDKGATALARVLENKNSTLKELALSRALSLPAMPWRRLSKFSRLRSNRYLHSGLVRCHKEERDAFETQDLSRGQCRHLVDGRAPSSSCCQVLAFLVLQFTGLCSSCYELHSCR